MVDTERLPMDVARSLITGITAGAGAYYAVNRSTLAVLVFLVPTYLLLLGVYYMSEKVLERMNEGEEDTKPWSDVVYAS